MTPSRLRRIATFALAAAVCGCAPEASSPEPAPEGRSQPLTAGAVADLIAADGAGHTVAVLSGPADPTGIDKVFEGVATGETAWLALVPAIEPELSPPLRESLQTALANALGPNPPGVLALVPDHADPGRICAEASVEARAAVEAVTDPGLQAARAECLEAVARRTPPAR